MWNSFYLCGTECLPRLIYDEMMPLKMFKRWEGQTNNTTWWSIFKSIFKHSIKNTSLSPLLVFVLNVRNLQKRRMTYHHKTPSVEEYIIIYIYIYLEIRHSLGDTKMYHIVSNRHEKSPGVQSSETERNVLGQVLLQKHPNVTRNWNQGSQVTCYDDHPNLAASVLVEEFICLMIDWKCIIFFFDKRSAIGWKMPK